jgi:hypothetical protein
MRLAWIPACTETPAEALATIEAGVVAAIVRAAAPDAMKAAAPDIAAAGLEIDAFNPAEIETLAFNSVVRFAVALPTWVASDTFSWPTVKSPTRSTLMPSPPCGQ